MRSNKLNTVATSTVEYVIIVILLVVFVAIGAMIAFSVFHFSLLGIGHTSPSLTSNPAPCNISLQNISTASKPNYFRLTVSEGSLGLNYTVFAGIGNAYVSPTRVGNYVVGLGVFSQDFQLAAPSNVFVANTTGSSVAVDGETYNAGGECTSIVQISG